MEMIQVQKVQSCMKQSSVQRSLIEHMHNLVELNFVGLLSKSCFVVVLWSGCFGGWVRYLTHNRTDIRKWTDCKLYYFMYDFGRHYSSMLLVLMSMEKCFAVYFPFKSKTFCTVKTAKWATGIVGAILAVYDSIQSYYRKSIVKSSGHNSCISTSDLNTFRSIISSVLYSFGPFIMMFVSNVAIVFKFVEAKCISKSTESTNQALAKSATRGTAMVVTVSVTFLLLTAPTAVEYAHTLSHAVRLGSNPVYNVFRYLTQYLNHSINGVLYIIVGTRFRNELLSIFRRKERSENVSNSHSPINMSLTAVGRGRFWLVWNLPKQCDNSLVIARQNMSITSILPNFILGSWNDFDVGFTLTGPK